MALVSAWTGEGLYQYLVHEFSVMDLVLFIINRVHFIIIPFLLQDVKNPEDLIILNLYWKSFQGSW